LARADIIDISKLSPATPSSFGATVTLVDEGHRQEGGVADRRPSRKADAKKGRISITSPLAARALIGKKKGASVEVVRARRRQGLRDHQGRVALDRNGRAFEFKNKT